MNKEIVSSTMTTVLRNSSILIDVPSIPMGFLSPEKTGTLIQRFVSFKSGL
ncbi:MAG: hypothetical protein LBH94_03850 [Deltaproteobacteria bacterium]|nr:hypothetical protein [Deltaproteobacteria bacterium]